MRVERCGPRHCGRTGLGLQAFCRETLTVLAQNTHLLLPSFGLADAQNDLAQLEKLRPRAARLLRLLEKADDGETALGSDVMSAALEGYAMLKVSGKGAGLDALRQGMSARFTRKGRVRACPPPPSIEPTSPGPNASRSKRGAPAARLFALRASLRTSRARLSVRRASRGTWPAKQGALRPEYRAPCASQRWATVHPFRPCPHARPA